MATMAIELDNRIRDAITYSGKGVPTLEDLQQMCEAVSLMREYLTESMVQSLALLIEEGTPESISFADIGAINTYAGYTRTITLDLLDDLDKLTILAHECSNMAEGLPYPHEPFIDKHGGVENHNMYRYLRREVGFAPVRGCNA